MRTMLAASAAVSTPLACPDPILRGQGDFVRVGRGAFNKQFMYGAFSEGMYRDMV